MRPPISPLGSSLTTSRPFRHTTFPVAASTNTRDGMLVTLYLFHSFICKNKKKKEKNMRGDVGKRNVDGKSEDKNNVFSAATARFPETRQREGNKRRLKLIYILQDKQPLCCLKDTRERRRWSKIYRSAVSPEVN